MSEAYITAIGIAVQTLIFLLGGFAFYIRSDATQKNNADSLRADVNAMKEELRKLTEVIITQAIQTTRIENLAELVTMLQRNVEDLRRGNGFVRGDRGIDREFKD